MNKKNSVNVEPITSTSDKFQDISESSVVQGAQPPSIQSNPNEYLRIITQEQIKELRSKVDKAIEGAGKDVDKAIKGIKDEKINLVEMLGVFVSLFTFISIDVQIFRTATNAYILVGFVFLMLFGLIAFNLVLKMVVEKEFVFQRKEYVSIFPNVAGLFGKSVPIKLKLFDITTWTWGFTLVLIEALLFLAGVTFVTIGSNKEFRNTTIELTRIDQQSTELKNDLDAQRQYLEELDNKYKIQENELIDLKKSLNMISSTPTPKVK